MSDLDFRITTSAELSGAKAVETQLEREIGKAKMLGKDYTELQQKLDKVRAAMGAYNGGKTFGDQLSESLHRVAAQIPGFERFKKIATELASGPLGLIAVGATAVAGAIAYATKAVKEFAAAEVVVTKMHAALAQNGNLTKEVSEQYQALADTLQDQTTIAGEAWIAVMTKMTQQGVQPEKMEQYTEAVKNLAALMGGDIETAASMMSRAINGNFTALSRYGIAVAEASTQTEKLDATMRQLSQKGGGQLEAIGQTLSGQWRNFTNVLGDASKGVGNFIARTGMLQGLTTILKDGFGFWKDKLDGIVPILPGLANKTAAAGGQIKTAAEAAKDFATELERIKTNADASAEGLARMLKVINDMATAQKEELERKEQLELATFREGADGRSSTANTTGEAAIKSKYLSLKSGKDLESLTQQRDAVAEHTAAMFEDEQAERNKLEALKARAATKQGSEVLSAEKQRLTGELDTEQKMLAMRLGQFMGAMGDGNPLKGQLQKAVDTGKEAGSDMVGVQAVADALAKRDKDGDGFLGRGLDKIEVLARSVEKTYLRLEQLESWNPESQSGPIANQQNKVTALERANAPHYNADYQRQNELLMAMQKIAANTANQQAVADSGTRTAQKDINYENTQTALSAQIKKVENQMYEGRSNEDFADRSGRGQKGTINLMRDKAGLEIRKKELEAIYKAKGMEEAEAITQEIEEIKKTLREAIQKKLQEPAFNTPGARPGARPYVPTIPAIQPAEVPGERPVGPLPRLTSVDFAPIEAANGQIADTAAALNTAARSLASNVNAFETVVPLLQESLDRLAILEEQITNLRPA